MKLNFKYLVIPVLIIVVGSAIITPMLLFSNKNLDKEINTVDNSVNTEIIDEVEIIDESSGTSDFTPTEPPVEVDEVVSINNTDGRAETELEGDVGYGFILVNAENLSYDVDELLSVMSTFYAENGYDTNTTLSVENVNGDTCTLEDYTTRKVFNVNLITLTIEEVM